MELQRSQDRIRRLEFDVDWPPGHVACYLVEGSEPALVDTAITDRQNGLERALSDHGFGLEDIEHVLITHPHLDHIGGVPELLDGADPTVYAPFSVRERFGRDPDSLGERVRHNCMRTGFADDRIETAVEMAVESLERNVELLAPEAVDVWMRPDERIPIGDVIVEATHLPGHQADHLSYSAEIAGERILFAGDMGILPFRPVVVNDGLDDGYRDAFDAFYTALDRMDQLDVDRIYPGHGPVHDDLDSVIELYHNSLNRRLDKVAECIANGYETAPEIVEAMTDDLYTNYLIPEIMSALAHLESTYRILSNRIDGVVHYER